VKKDEPLSRHKKRLIAGAWAIGLLLLLAPVAAALQFAHRLADEQTALYLQGISADLLQRVRASREQSHAAFDALLARPGGTPCSPGNLNQMRVIAAKADYLQGLGFIEGGSLKCSTIGEAVVLDEPSRIDPDGTAWWEEVEFPDIAGKQFNLSSRNGYAALSLPGRIIDILQPDSTVSVVHVGTRSHRVVRSRGAYKTEWFELFHGQPITLELDDTMLAMQLSNTGNSFAIAAMPQAEVQRRVMHAAWRFGPVGLVIGVALAVAVFLVTRRQLSLKAALQYALQKKEFFMVYQPVIELATGRCVGAEALIRWHQRDGQVVSPLVFIPAAEESGLIQQVTLQVMDMVARDAADLIRENPETHIAINFSAEDLQSPETEARLQKMIRDAGANSCNIMIEATERGLMTPEKAKDVLISVRSSGFKVAIDDFGTGNSSLSYLATYDLDFLKIDKMFVDALDSDAPTKRVAFHIIEIARSLGLQMIAEGVETETQRDILNEAGVQYAQGWLFARPMAMRDLVEFMRVRNAALRRPPMT